MLSSPGVTQRTSAHKEYCVQRERSAQSQPGAGAEHRGNHIAVPWKTASNHNWDVSSLRAEMCHSSLARQIIKVQ